LATAERDQRREARRRKAQNHPEQEQEVPRYNLVQMQAAHQAVFGTKVLREHSLDLKEASIQRAYRKNALAQHPDKGGDAVGFGKLEDSKEILMHISRYGLRRYNYSEMTWAKDHLGFEQPSNCGVVVPTADQACIAYDAKMIQNYRGNKQEEVALYECSYALARNVLLDIADVGVWQVLVNPFDPRRSFPSMYFQ
jgi:hypothetical protein